MLTSDTLTCPSKSHNKPRQFGPSHLFKPPVEISWLTNHPLKKKKINQILQLWHSAPNDGAVIIGQVHSTGPSVCASVKCEGLILIRCVQKKEVVCGRSFRERTVGDGHVQIALPGHLPRFVDGVLRCKNTTTGLLFTARSHSDTASDLFKRQRKTMEGKSTAVPCCTRAGCPPSAEVLLCHWKCGFNHR